MVLAQEQKELLKKLIFEDNISSYDELCKRIGGPRPPIRNAIKQIPGVIRIQACPYCKKEMVITRLNKQQKFCSAEHKNKYHSANRKKDKLSICENCGKEFYQYSFRNNKFCSCLCAAEHREKQKREKMDTK